ncbi:hypothetical protein GCM10007962_15070 [Yeosuana aromativorans]|uniref:DUF4138 domain-containing protein n=2 Tax=Yeosuana aromativorans TaxID=288019 RepID=A0A8J3FFQ3_9FLAO|nr:hypothetical protein GCM10007962_15070 [Yeosuana aromativorans]
MNVALFFPDPIRQGITGSENFVFTYNREREQNFGLLQASPGEVSNLLAVTSNGQVYAYILKYERHLARLNYFIREGACIGNEKPILDSLTNKIDRPKNIEKENYYRKFSEYLLRSRFSSMASIRKQGIVLGLLKVVHNMEEVYLVLEIKNRSGIDFGIDYLNVYRSIGTKKRKSSYQKLRMDEIYSYKTPSIVKDNQSKDFVYVLPKFVLGENEKLQIELMELNGSRKLKLIK